MLECSITVSLRKENVGKASHCKRQHSVGVLGVVPSDVSTILSPDLLSLCGSSFSSSPGSDPREGEGLLLILSWCGLPSQPLRLVYLLPSPFVL